ncbi:hypothetical protein TNCV_2409071 [Trichonephila clavipes]|nr:hypothetical protein TNCV_2409071 [Trichonephila clavipes]
MMDRMFASTSQRYDNGLQASYNILHLIAKSRKSRTIGEELILPPAEEDDTDLKDALGVIIDLQEETQELEVRLNFGADVFHRLS